MAPPENSSSLPAETDIARISVKAPPFWRARPEIWFCQMESQFALANIKTALTKFHHVVSALQPEELCLVGDLIKKPPTADPEDPYKALKDRLCTQYQDTEEERLRELISGLQLGDRKPSRLLLEMKSKAGDRLSDDLLKSLFLQRLPTHVQQILAISKDTVDKLAEMADGIMSASASSTAIQAVSRPPLAEDPIKAMLLDISERLAKLETSQDSRSRSHSRGARRRPFRQRSSSRSNPNNSGHCWYHQRFGQQATNCNQPCTFETEN